MSARSLLLLVLVLHPALVGCPPALDDFQVVPVLEVRDGGMMGPDRGTPCGEAFVAAVATSSSSGGEGEIHRFSLSDRGVEPCRQTALGRRLGELRGAVRAVAAMSDGTLRIAADDAVVALDAEGYPRWRQAVELPGEFVPAQLFPLRLEGREVLGAVSFGRRASSATGLVLLDEAGAVVTRIEDVSSGVAAFAGHPDGDRVWAGLGGGAIHSAPLTSASTTARDLTPELDAPTERVTLRAIATDHARGVEVLTYNSAVGFWDPAAAREPAAVQRVDCPDRCDEFVTAVPDPTAPFAAFAICVRAGTRSLVRVELLAAVEGASACELLADGGTLGRLHFVDVTAFAP